MISNDSRIPVVSNVSERYHASSPEEDCGAAFADGHAPSLPDHPFQLVQEDTLQRVLRETQLKKSDD